jgi:hypothetical protein
MLNDKIEIEHASVIPFQPLLSLERVEVPVGNPDGGCAGKPVFPLFPSFRDHCVLPSACGILPPHPSFIWHK